MNLVRAVLLVFILASGGAVQGQDLGSMTLDPDSCKKQAEGGYVCSFDNGTQIPVDEESYAIILKMKEADRDITMDLDETRDQQQAAIKAREEEMMARAQEFISALDAVIQQDARGWVTNKYEAGSFRNVRITERSPETQRMVVNGQYTYNRTQDGAVSILIEGGEVSCLKFWDSPSCRPVGKSHSRGLAALAITGMLRSMAQTGGSGGGSCDVVMVPDSQGNVRPTNQAC